MTTDDKIQDEKLKPQIKRETAKISALSSGKIDKSEYLMGEEILPSNESRIIEQVRFTYSEQRKKEMDAITNQNKEPFKMVIIKIEKYLKNQLKKDVIK